MMVWSINLLVLAAGILIVGLIKPNWIMFWMEKPGRLPVVILSSVLFMVGVVMFGEANQQKTQEVAKQTQPAGKSDNVSDKPTPVVIEVIDEIKKKTLNK